MKKRKIHPLVKLFFVSALFVGVAVIVLLVMGYRYMTFSEGKFIGKIQNNVPYEGSVKYADGSEAKLYEGKKLIFSEGKYKGSTYEGELKNIVADGKGKMIFANGVAVYEGSFLSNEISGKGVMTYENGSVYEGDFVNGKKEGNGILKIKDQEIYTGEFADDLYNGHGVLEFLKGSETDILPEPTTPTELPAQTTEKYNFGDTDPTESATTEPEQKASDFAPYHTGGYEVVGKYEGDFKNGAQHGTGTQYYSNGDMYEGDYVNGRRTGKGRYTWKTGEIYEGGFCDDLLDTRVTDENGLIVRDANGKASHGDKAVYTRNDGTIFTGYFEAGKQVNVEDE